MTLIEQSKEKGNVFSYFFWNQTLCWKFSKAGVSKKQKFEEKVQWFPTIAPGTTSTPLLLFSWLTITAEHRYRNTMLCPIICNSNTIELTVHTSCYCLRLTLYYGASLLDQLPQIKHMYTTTLDLAISKKYSFENRHNCRKVVLSFYIDFSFPCYLKKHISSI